MTLQDWKLVDSVQMLSTNMSELLQPLRVDRRLLWVHKQAPPGYLSIVR